MKTCTVDATAHTAVNTAAAWASQSFEENWRSIFARVTAQKEEVDNM